MNCNNCPHKTDGKCCHQSIMPVIKPSVVVNMVAVTLLDSIKAHYDEAYEYYGDFYED
ncbi:hypothetical protein [Psychrobacter sp. BF1]|uniref:hypothetical protein n=1 Tax=Psychrobacter sp. BF1 TaxID=2821147 RepID=UPI001C4DFD92|nr:hypothetical protein [Psychrobacter sp. BF1]